MASAPRLRVPPPPPLETHRGQGIGFIHDTASKAGKEGRPVLLTFDEMPEWFRRESNQWILHGYRPISGSAHASFCNWSYIHNESVTIYSHLIPAVSFLLGEWHIQQYLTSRYSGVTSADFIYVEHFCLRLDILGVVIFILGDLVLGIYIVFWREPLPRNLYWSRIGGFGTLTIFMTMHPTAFMFVATGLSGVAPLIQGLNVFGMSQMMRKAFPYTLAKAGCLLFGTAFYATRFLERRYPGKFDLWGSHSIFHILVVCAAVVQLMGYLDAFDYSHANLARLFELLEMKHAFG
ncbi:hemolysin-III family protein [Nemania diffusa]|nr:hemolysin-III family protein [Nemania diffusa]